MEEHGFDKDFVDEVHEDLRCVVCRFVLMQPVQIMKCGHRFCHQCFERIKCHAAAQGMQQPCCPIDRDTIDLRNVFQDTGMARAIANLKVKCQHNQLGCSWIGDLKDSDYHEEGCSYTRQKTLGNPSTMQETLIDANAFNSLCDRMAKMENDAFEKEKDILHLKYNYDELRKQLNTRESEIQGWSTKYDHVENEMKHLRAQNEEFKRRIEKENEVLTVRNQFLDYKVSSLEKQLAETKNVPEENMEQKIKELVLSCKNDEEENKDVDQLIKELRNKINDGTDEIGALKVKVADNSNRVEVMKTRIDADHKVLDNRVRDLSNKVKELTDGGDMEKLKEDIYKHIYNLDIAQGQVASLENITLHGAGGRPKDKVMVQWKVYEYQRLFDIGTNVYSPMFRTQVEGYSFKLYIKWSGDEKEKIGLYFHLVRSKDYGLTQKLEPYNLRETLQVAGSKGDIRSKVTSEEHFNEVKGDCYTVHEGEAESRLMSGWTAFLKKQELDDYIIDDTLIVRCILTHPL